MNSITLPGLLLAASLLIAAPVVAQQPDPADLSIEERALIASEIYAALPVYFAHWEGTPADFDLRHAYKDYLSKALSAGDRREFSLATMAFIGQLRNGHTKFWDSWLYEEHGQPLGFTARLLDGEWIIAESRIEGLRPGQVIQSVDGEAVGSFAARLLPMVAASSKPAAEALLFHPQRQEHLFPPRFTLGLDDGSSVVVDRKTMDLTVAPMRSEERLIENGRVGYIRIPSFGNPAFEESAVAFIEGHKDVPALIVDVRGNGGGDTPQKLIRSLMERPYRWFTEATPLAPATLRQYFADAQFRWKGDVTQPQGEPYRGTVVFLVDALCASACEDLLVPFKDNARATIVGETTQGTTGQPHVQQLGRDMSLMVGMKRAYFPDGSAFEGVGVQPDVAVQPTRSDLRQGRDRALQRAIEIATRATQSTGSL